MICYLLAFIDRGNVGMASLQMNHDLGMSAQVFGFGSSLFFISYFFSKCRAISRCRNTARGSGSHGS
ncbi:major facilitator superfamily permease [Burkholderia cepacia]|nr:major facilitator superfamily permease [Burkholderia cepacia]